MNFLLQLVVAVAEGLPLFLQELQVFSGYLVVGHVRSSQSVAVLAEKNRATVSARFGRTVPLRLFKAREL
jgi:hypothetical protein